MRLSTRKADRNEFNIVVTSMLDINFLLIMFFMMTTQFQRQTSALLNLPQEQGEKETQPDEAGLEGAQHAGLRGTGRGHYQHRPGTAQSALSQVCRHGRTTPITVRIRSGRTRNQ